MAKKTRAKKIQPAAAPEVTIGANLLRDGSIPPAKFAEVRLPLGDRLPDAYLLRHVEIQLSPRQAKALASVYNGIKARLPRLPSGGAIRRPTDGIRAILELIAEVSDPE